MLLVLTLVERRMAIRAMSKEAPVGLTFMEKLLGLLLIAIGALWFYVTYTALPGFDPFFTLFLGSSGALIIIGIILFIAKNK
jgi:hypothetical protein